MLRVLSWEPKGHRHLNQSKRCSPKCLPVFPQTGFGGSLQTRSPPEAPDSHNGLGCTLFWKGLWWPGRVWLVEVRSALQPWGSPHLCQGKTFGHVTLFRPSIKEVILCQYLKVTPTRRTWWRGSSHVIGVRSGSTVGRLLFTSLHRVTDLLTKMPSQQTTLLPASRALLRSCGDAFHPFWKLSAHMVPMTWDQMGTALFHLFI